MQMVWTYLCLMVVVGFAGYGAKLANEGYFDEGEPHFRVTSYPPSGMPVTVGGEWRCAREPACASHGPQTFTITPYEQIDANGWQCLERGGCAPTAKEPVYSDPGADPAGTSI